MRRYLVPCVCLLLCGCASPPEPAAGGRTTPAAEPVSARSAFQRMFIHARSWAPDAEPLRVAEIDVADYRAEGGNAAAWETVFVSASRRQAKRYVYSVVHRPVRNLRSGVNADPAESWSGGGGAEPFLIQAFKKDSTDAYAVAVKKAREYVRKNPKQRVGFVLEKTRRFPDPAWRVYWGESVSTSGYSIFVDATTGEYLATAR